MYSKQNNWYNMSAIIVSPNQGLFNNYMDVILPFFDYLPTYLDVDIFTLNMDKKCSFWPPTHLTQ